MANALSVGKKMSYLAIKVGAWLVSGLACLVLLYDASKPPVVQPVGRGQITTTLISIVPTTLVPTTTAAPKGCMEYVADAIGYGWPADQAPTLAKVMWRESRCDPLAFNSQDSNNGSRGLLQVNGVHAKWLMEQGFINKLDDLFYPDVNLKAALHLWSMVGWQAWASTHGQ